MPASDEVRQLLIPFWFHKNEAVRELAEKGKSDTGAQSRNARHMRSLAIFVKQIFLDAGLSENEVKINGVIPGYFRRSKSWDVVATHKGNLVAVVELKSQVGSEGRNGNNRIEEAIGNSVDVATTQEFSKSFGTLPIWTAFCVVFGSAPENAGIVGPRGKTLFPLESVFDGMTYARQWEIAVERFVQTGTYSAGWMITTWVRENGQIEYTEPVPTATAKTLETQIHARVAFAKQALN